jgi:hypothetical protein
MLVLEISTYSLDVFATMFNFQVKLALYKNNVEVAYVVFNGTGSNNTSWFNRDAIIESPYTAIKTDSFNYFSILG